MTDQSRVRASWKQHVAPLLIIVGVLALANSMYLTGSADPSAIGWSSSITTNACHIECGAPVTDPNTGYVTQALGHRAAEEIVHGHIPWWNPYEGLGSPLAGETQAAALFPAVLLFLLPSGLLWFHLLFELLAGFSAYFLARRLGLARFIACVAGLLFCLNGTFSWVGNAPINPIAFLPITLLVVERIVNPTTPRSRIPNWALLGVVLALTWYSGFPEVMYLDILFAVGWAVLRLCQSGVLQRRAKVVSLALGSLVGVVLAAPGIVAFKDYLSLGYVGGHLAQIAGSSGLPIASAPMLLTPYVYGTIYQNYLLSVSWDSATGYFTTGLVALALYGMFNRRERALKLYLGGWLIAGLMGAFGLLYVHNMWDLIPLVDTTWLERFIFPSCELALVILACLGLQDLLKPSKRISLLLACTITLLVSVAGLLYAGSRVHGTVVPHLDETVRVATDVGSLVILLILMAAGLVSRPRVIMAIASVALVLESFCFLAIPTLTSPTATRVDQGPITFLQAHQGLHRFLSLGPISPNWGSYFGLYELSIIDLPVADNWAYYINHTLAPGRPDQANEFNVIETALPVALNEEMGQLNYHLASYEQSGVKYVTISSLSTILPSLLAQGVTKVYHDSMVTIYKLPHPAPFFSTTSPCVVHTVSVSEVHLSCSTATSLTRLELYMPGWSATVNGHAVRVRERDGVFQKIAVPKGDSTVEFTFLPVHERDALLLAGLGVLAVLSSPLWYRRRKSSSVQSTQTETNPSEQE